MMAKVEIECAIKMQKPPFFTPKGCRCVCEMLPVLPPKCMKCLLKM